MKKRFFRGDKNTSGCVIVGMVTTVPGRKVDRRVGMGGVMGETGCLNVLVPGMQHEVWMMSHQVDVLLFIPRARGLRSVRPVCVVIWLVQYIPRDVRWCLMGAYVV